MRSKSVDCQGTWLAVNGPPVVSPTNFNTTDKAETTKATQIGLRGLTCISKVEDEAVEKKVTEGQSLVRLPTNDRG